MGTKKFEFIKKKKKNDLSVLLSSWRRAFDERQNKRSQKVRVS